MPPRIAAGSEQGSAAGQAPLRFGDDALLWAAWVYDEDGLTQREIAAKMGLSRASVNAYLADARTRGIVNIEIAPDRFRALSRR
ncbi:MAG: MarR family transcriptional regulator [Amaricoccus sp.]